MRNELRDAVVTEVKSRVLAAAVKQAGKPGGLPLAVLINDTLYHEKKRLHAHRDVPEHASDVAFWNEIKAALGKAAEPEQRALLQRIIDRYVEEILGNFSPAVYDLSTRVLPRALPLLLNAMSPLKLLKRGGIPSVGDTIQIQGNVDALRRMDKLGTVILAPTHVSNLDSVVIGWALYEMGLPPFTYGAGLNLFTNPMLSFFMRNLGAYRVDRLKKAPLYKDILKEYATVSIEHGQPNLFFPGGTRIRSGEVEQHLKLGLLSSGLKAYINNLIHKKERPNVYVVPATLNYQLVLEASTLIEDHLKSIGKARYIITDDESSRPAAVARFMRSLMSLDSRINVTVGEPLDVFGNRVDEEGRSLDHRGRVIDIRRYVFRDGVPAHAPQRDRVYAREAGLAVAAAFRRNVVAMTTNVVAFTAFRVLADAHPDMDLYRLLRTAGDGAGIEMGVLAERVRAVADRLGRLADEGEIRLDAKVGAGDAGAVIADALRHFGSYHGTPVLERRGDRVFAGDMNLLLYYHNRLKGYGLEGAAQAVAGEGR